MIKLMFCLRRLPTLSVEEFQAYWYDVHRPLVESVREHLRARRYVQCHMITNSPIPSAGDTRGPGARPFDGVAEFWWDSFDDIIAAGGSSEARAAARMLREDEARFIDLPNSPIYYYQEREIFAEA